MKKVEVTTPKKLDTVKNYAQSTIKVALAVKLPKYTNVPRWLVIQGEMDLRLFLLDNMLKKPRSAIEKMIDEATGFDKQVEKQALELIAECRWLKKEYDKENN